MTSPRLQKAMMDVMKKYSLEVSPKDSKVLRSNYFIQYSLIVLGRIFLAAYAKFHHHVSVSFVLDSH